MIAFSANFNPIHGEIKSNLSMGGGVDSTPPLLSQLLKVLETQTKKQKVAGQNLRGGTLSWFYRFFAVIYR